MYHVAQCLVKRVKARNGQIMFFCNGKRISKEKAKKLKK